MGGKAGGGLEGREERPGGWGFTIKCLSFGILLPVPLTDGVDRADMASSSLCEFRPVTLSFRILVFKLGDSFAPHRDAVRHLMRR